MNVSCKVIEDLLPLYHDGVCSGESRALVEEHLKTCENCGKVKEALNAEEAPEVKADEKKALKGIKKQMRRRTLRGIALGIVLVLLLSACGIGVLCYVNWNNERQALLRFAEGKERELNYTHIWIGGPWDGNEESFKWTDGDYTFRVGIADPFQGTSHVDVTQFYQSDRDYWVWLEIELDDKDTYWYNIGISSEYLGMQFAMDGDLNLKEENAYHSILLSEFQEEICKIIEAAQAEWPFLTE